MMAQWRWHSRRLVGRLGRHGLAVLLLVASNLSLLYLHVHTHHILFVSDAKTLVAATHLVFFLVCDLQLCAGTKRCRGCSVCDGLNSCSAFAI